MAVILQVGLIIEISIINVWLMLLPIHVLLVGKLSRVKSPLLLNCCGHRLPLIKLIESVVVRSISLLNNAGPVEHELGLLLAGWR